jgi:hypothetical protein
VAGRQSFLRHVDNKASICNSSSLTILMKRECKKKLNNVPSAVKLDWDATGSVRRDAMARKRKRVSLSLESREALNDYED